MHTIPGCTGAPRWPRAQDSTALGSCALTDQGLPGRFHTCGKTPPFRACAVATEEPINHTSGGIFYFEME